MSILLSRLRRRSLCWPIRDVQRIRANVLGVGETYNALIGICGSAAIAIRTDLTEAYAERACGLFTGTAGLLAPVPE